MITISPSKLARTSSCTASLMINPIVEEPVSSYASRGTAIHLIAAEALENRFNKKRKALKKSTIKKALEIYPKLDIQEAENYAKAYCDYVMQTIDDYDHDNVELHVEKTASLKSDDVSITGTADAVVYYRGTLHVFDLKTGWNKVSPIRNKQLLAYAYLMIRKPFKKYKIKRLYVHIVQPSSDDDYAEAYRVTKKDFKRFKSLLSRLIKAVKTNEVVFKPTQDNCKYCPHSLYCVALSKFEGIDLDKVDAWKLKPDFLKQTLEESKIMEEAAKSRIKQIVHAALEGATVEGYKLSQGRRLRSWKDVDAMIYYVNRERKVPKSKITKTSVLTPAQCEKVTGLDLSDFVEESRSAPYLIKGKDDSKHDFATRRAFDDFQDFIK